MTNKNWINFARYSSPPIGKGRMYQCELNEQEGELILSIDLDGTRFEGKLYDVRMILAEQGEEE